MGSLHETNPSLWAASTEGVVATTRPLPTSGTTFDVAVVGAGIAGLTTARLLAAQGASVLVLEAGDLCSGVTAYTTAKVSALQRTTLSEIERRHDADAARAYAEANVAGVELIARLVEQDAIVCDLERASACTYTAEASEVEAVEAEHAAAQRAGLGTRLDGSTELPFEVRAAVWLDDQLQFHPRRFCVGLAEALSRDGGVVVDRTRVVEWDEGRDACELTTTAGPVRAAHVVFATHLPFPLAGGFFARAHPYRSYALAARVAGDRPRGMYISVESPTRSVRSTADGWVILGGEGHKVGHDDDTRGNYERLEAWARDVYRVEDVGYRWSAQDYETVDGIPYVGRISANHGRTWVATGFRKWGMSNGAASALLLADLLGGRDNAWADTFDATRLAPGASIKQLITENAEVGKRFVADKVKTWRARPADELAPGEGDIVTLDGDPVAAFRDEAGELHAVSANCTHLGCRVAFNTAERTWDCPCHGSRFDVDGRVLQGPAVEDLAPMGDGVGGPPPAG